MSKLYSGITMVVIGIAAIVIYNKLTVSQRENAFFEKPYLKNFGAFLILVGAYSVIQYFLS